MIFLTAAASVADLQGNMTCGGDAAVAVSTSDGGEFGTMFRLYLTRQAGVALESATIQRRKAIDSERVSAYAADVKKALQESLGPLPFGADGQRLDPSFRGGLKFDGFRIENYVIHSADGWEANPTVYLPDPEVYPPPWTPVVVAVGHTGKHFRRYQLAGQVVARCGYLAAVADPPGVSGEKEDGNDHFRDGGKLYLVGKHAQRFFVLDPLRVLDYLETRGDVTLARGAGMTGLSGGGYTALHCSILDDRIRVSGPSCFNVPYYEHPVRTAYGVGAEYMFPGQFRKALDTPDLLLGIYPKPLLMMAGERDSLFTPGVMQPMAAETLEAYDVMGQAEKAELLMDPGGHDYTLGMAFAFVRWTDRWLGAYPVGRPLPAIAEEDIMELSPAELASRPRQDINMESVAREEALMLRETRPPTADLDEVAAFLFPAGVPDWSPSPHGAKSGKPFPLVNTKVEEVLLKTDDGISVPGTFVSPAVSDEPVAALLFVDEEGRWERLRKNGALARIANPFQGEGDLKMAVFSIDVRGWGDTSMAFAPNDILSWCTPERWAASIGIGLGDPVLVMRLRDCLAALAYLRSRPEVAPERIIVGGSGEGSLLAAHLCALDRDLRGLMINDFPASFELLATTSERSAWSETTMLPNVLQFYDLPELIAALDIPVLLLNPLDSVRAPLSRRDIKRIYAGAIEQPRVEIDQLTGKDIARRQVSWVRQQVSEFP
jgi:dienelactone hydrolase